MKTRSAFPFASGIFAAKSFTLATAASVTLIMNGSDSGTETTFTSGALDDMGSSGLCRPKTGVGAAFMVVKWGRKVNEIAGFRLSFCNQYATISCGAQSQGHHL